jgi:hypothetical protein
MLKGADAALTAIRRLTERCPSEHCPTEHCPSEHCPSEHFDGVQRNPVRSESGGDAASETLPAVGIGPRHVAVGPAWLLRKAGRAWSAEAGGTSGALWGAAIEAAGKSLTDDRSDYSPADFVAAAHAFTATITALGRAQLGDKTMVDALLPFLDSLRMDVSQGVEFGQAWRAAANQATTAALATAALSPRLGRARPLAERSIGTPDAGATSFALIVEALGQS